MGKKNNKKFNIGALREFELQKKYRERRMIIGVSATLLLVVVLGVLTDGKIFTTAKELLYSLEPNARQSRIREINCRKEANKHTVYCQGKQASIKSTWDGIVKNGGKSNPFGLNDNKY